MLNIPIRKIPTMSKIPIQIKKNTTTAIIITIREKNTLVIADAITILQREEKNVFASKISQQNFN